MEIQSEQELTQVRVETPEGALRAARRVPSPPGTVLIPLRWTPGEPLTVRTTTPAGEQITTIIAPDARVLLDVELQAPAGQPARRLQPGDTVAVPMVAGSEAFVALSMESHAAGLLRIEAGPTPGTLEPVRAERSVVTGERVVEVLPIGALASARVSLTHAEGRSEVDFSVETSEISAAAAQAALAVQAVRFPAEADGASDLARRPDRIDLPAPWWSRLLRTTGLGFRPRDPWAPWGWIAVDLSNTSDTSIHVSVRATVRDPVTGEPAAAFRPRLRDGDDGSGALSVLLRVPAATTATATLPLYVDDPTVTEGLWPTVVEVTPIGVRTPLHQVTPSIVVSRGSTLVSLGFPAVLLTALVGLVGLLRVGPRWLATARTQDLVTVALFAALQYLFGAAATVLGLGVAAALGPFSPLLTGLIDDAFSCALLATLITLRPRPGTASALVILGWMLRALGLGAFSPTDLLYVGSRVMFLESALWSFGLTRSGLWRDDPAWRRWFRLGAALSLAGLASTASMLVLQTVLYRLFFAPWYVAMLLIGPAFLYIWLATALAVGFAASLREVEP